MSDVLEQEQAAVEPVAPVATRVKPLKWSQFNGRIGAYKPFGGSYVITEYPGMKQPFALEQHFSGSLTQYYENADDAKAAAQADYEQRILSTLEPVATREDVVRKCINAIPTSMPWKHYNATCRALRALLKEPNP